MRFFKREEVADSRFTFIDSETNEAIDINDPKYKIVHYSGVNEVEDVAETTMTKVSGETGVYIVNWTIPNTADENETYFVVAKGTHPVDGTDTIIEDFYRVLPESFFAGGGGAGSGLTIKFSKP